MILFFIKLLVISIKDLSSTALEIIAPDSSIKIMCSEDYDQCRMDGYLMECSFGHELLPSMYSIPTHIRTMCWALPSLNLLSLSGEDRPTRRFTSGSPQLRELVRS